MQGFDFQHRNPKVHSFVYVAFSLPTFMDLTILSGVLIYR